MKQMILTGIGSEQSFQKKGSVTSYFLVFNDGELRVPVSEEAAEVVIKEMYGKEEPQEEAQVDQDDHVNGSDYTYRSQTSDEDEDDGVGQI